MVSDTDPFDKQLESTSEAEAAEWSCRALIRSLLHPGADERPDVRAALDYARRTLEAGAESMLQRATAIEDKDKRIDAFGDIEFLVEGALRIGAGLPLPEVERMMRRSPGRPQKVDDETLRSEVLNLMDHHGEFAAGDRDWNAQARLEAAIAEKFDLSISRARGRIEEPLREWRRSKIGL